MNKNIKIILMVLFWPFTITVFLIMFLWKKGAKIQKIRNQKAKEILNKQNNLSDDEYIRMVAVNTICNN